MLRRLGGGPSSVRFGILRGFSPVRGWIPGRPGLTPRNHAGIKVVNIVARGPSILVRAGNAREARAMAVQAGAGFEAEAVEPQAAEPQSLLDEHGEAWIPESRLGPLQDRAEKLNKRAAKLGCPPISVAIVSERFEPVTKPGWDGKLVVVGHKREVCVRVSGAAPQVAGWTFVARVQHGEGGDGNIVSKAPDERGTKLDEALWLAEPVCEHCKLARHRKDTFILRDGAGVLKQVGRNCLADFLRSEDVEIALAFWKYLHELELAIGAGGDDDEGEGGWGGGSGRRYFDVQSVLHAAARVIRVDGYVSRSRARESLTARATADTVGWVCSPPWSRDEEANKRVREELARFEATPQDDKVAADTLEWVRRRLDPTSDYERNIKVALTPDYVEPRNLGLVTSAVQAWLRLTVQREAENRPVTADAGWLGEVGQRLRKIRVRVTNSKVWTNDVTGFTTNLLVFVDEAGHELKWFASGSRGIEIGRDVLLTGTVKEHSEWKGRKGTILSRCVVA